MATADAIGCLLRRAGILRDPPGSRPDWFRLPALEDLWSVTNEVN